MKNKIIIISGKQYSGKDTVAKVLLEHFKTFKRIGIGDAIKIEYGRQKSLSFEEIEAQKHLYREDLIALGNWGRAQHPDYWLKKILELDYNIIVPDIRFAHEVKMFKERGAFALRVEASKSARMARGTITNENDSTETGLDDYKIWDYILDNSKDYETLLSATKPLIVKLEEWAVLQN